MSTCTAGPCGSGRTASGGNTIGYSRPVDRSHIGPIEMRRASSVGGARLGHGRRREVRSRSARFHLGSGFFQTGWNSHRLVSWIRRESSRARRRNPGPAAREGTNVAAKRRCEWAASDPLLLDYHDTEWGTQEHDDRKLFEFLILDGAQAGLSWLTILRKRENYRRAFDRFDPPRVAKYDARKVRSLLTDDGIVRNRLKIRAAVTNAREVLTIRKEFGSF